MTVNNNRMGRYNEYQVEKNNKIKNQVYLGRLKKNKTVSNIRISISNK